MSQQEEQPQANISEQVVLGCMMTDQNALYEAMSKLTDEDFYNPKHQTVFDAIKAISEQDTADNVTSVMVAQKLTTDKTIDYVGGAEYLAELVMAAAAPAGVAYHIEQMQAATSRRRVIAAGMRITQLGRSNDASAEDIVNLAVNEALSLEKTDEKNDCVSAYDAAEDMLKMVDDIQNESYVEGVQTGFSEIDETMHGFLPGQMIVVAGRPGMGKSTLGMDFARHAALEDSVPTVIFSLEMGRNELMQRLLSAETGVPLSAFNDPRVREKDGRTLGLTDESWTRINEAWAGLKDKPLYVDDSADLTLTDIRAKCRRLQRTIGLKFVVIDYLQLMSNSARASENRQQEVSAMSRAIKQLAKQLEVPIVVLSQLNRNSEQRNDRKPQLSDLRESGSIEQDADAVFLVHRPDYYDKEDRPGEADVILAKHRNGPTATFALAFLGNTSHFQDMPKDYSAGI